VFRKKTPTHVFDYNSGISWSIFILSISMETGINIKYSTIYVAYLMAWWRRKCITLNVTEVYFIKLMINIGRHSLCSMKKTPTFVSIITLAFPGQFLYFLYQWKHKWIVYREINKFYNNIILNVSPHYLIKSAHFETTAADRFLQCVRSNRLFATFTETQKVV